MGIEIDLKKHVMYSPLMEKIIKEHLGRKYSKNEIEPMWEKVQQQYAAFLKDLPYLGGKKNTHNGTGGTYDCIMIFAYYEALDHTPDMDELYQATKEKFPDEALGWIELSSKAHGEQVGASINKTMRIPGMKRLFIPMMKKIAGMMFGAKAGFENRLISYDKKSIRFDILRCPYC